MVEKYSEWAGRYSVTGLLTRVVTLCAGVSWRSVADGPSSTDCNGYARSGCNNALGTIRGNACGAILIEIGSIPAGSPSIWK